MVSHPACASAGENLTSADALVPPPRLAAASMQTPAGHQQGPAAPVGSSRSQPGGPTREAPATTTTPGAPAVAATQQSPAAMIRPGIPAVATAQQSSRPMPAQQVPMNRAGQRRGSAGRGAAGRQQAPRARPVFSQSARMTRQPSAQVRGPSILPACRSIQQQDFTLGMVACDPQIITCSYAVELKPVAQRRSSPAHCHGLGAVRRHWAAALA